MPVTGKNSRKGGFSVGRYNPDLQNSLLSLPGRRINPATAFGMPQWFAFLLVFVGGGLGSISRYGLALLIWPVQGKFPWATFAANGLACLLLGYWLGLHAGGGLTEQRRLLLTTGFCGGFSTFSTFTAESFRLWQDGRQTEAFVYVAGSLAVCLVCLFLGLKIAS